MTGKTDNLSILKYHPWFVDYTYVSEKNERSNDTVTFDSFLKNFSFRYVSSYRPKPVKK